MCPGRCGSVGASRPVAALPGATSTRRCLSAYLDPPEFLRALAPPRYAAGWEVREPGILCPRIRARRGTARVQGRWCLAASCIPGDRVHLPKSPGRATQEPACPEMRRETWKQGKEHACARGWRGLRRRASRGAFQDQRVADRYHLRPPIRQQPSPSSTHRS
jgi:hypothetical protein